MKKIIAAVLALVMAAGMVLAQSAPSASPTAMELLRRIDDNEIYDTIQYEGSMIIQYQGRRYVKTMRAWARGNSDSFIEFTNREDRGTKYLKTNGRLYVYSPDTEEVMLISGHMLKESMMGSDMSYEDTIDNGSLESRYTPSITGSENWNGRACWILELTAKKRAESYPKQKMWIDKANGDMLHSEQYALSGAKLKEVTVLKVQEFGGRRFPVEIEMRDLLRRDSKTTFTMSNVILDAPIADSVFSQRNLSR
ncbi:MAG: outer membrane lipoprotein-sorting protein [Treponema sp.]|jgi:outer membrane lipoprotein-sorting protein|nr:outer membrane lipoprotein-sorting protein [Treponema sp.]